jgi:hypothetical protein
VNQARFSTGLWITRHRLWKTLWTAACGPQQKPNRQKKKCVSLAHSFDRSTYAGEFGLRVVCIAEVTRP